MANNEEYPKATPAEPGSANIDATCSDCLCALQKSDYLYCSRLFFPDTGNRRTLNPKWKACTEFRDSSEFDLLKDWLRGSLRQITNNGDFWMGKRASVFVEGDRIRIRDKSDRTETIFLYDETEALGILRAMETGQKVLDDLPPRGIEEE